jgi:predicted GNAT family acetyltransferase
MGKSPGPSHIGVMPSAVRDNPARSRFELDADGVTAVANYRRDGGGVLTFTHTEVPPQARHGGIASRLIEGALAVVRARGWKIVPRCSFVEAYVDKHPEVRDLLA